MKHNELVGKTLYNVDCYTHAEGPRLCSIHVLRITPAGRDLMVEDERGEVCRMTAWKVALRYFPTVREAIDAYVKDSHGRLVDAKARVKMIEEDLRRVDERLADWLKATC